MGCFRRRWGGRGGMARRLRLRSAKCELIADEPPQELLDLIDVITNQAVCGEPAKAQVPCASYRISVSRVLFFGYCPTT